jgi:hypothetical protein
MCFEDFGQLVLYAALLAPGCCVPIDAHTFSIFVPTGTPCAGARRIPVENDLLNFFFVLFN